MTAPLPSQLRLLPILTVALLTLALAGCRNSYEWHQKLTITVDTPQGERTGSAVTAVSWSRNGFNVVFRSGAPFLFDMVGEATVVDLGQDRFLFALLYKEGNYEFPGTLLPSALTNKQQFNSMSADLLAKTETLPVNVQLAVPYELMPRFVTFTDIHDPASIVEVNPERLRDVFGDGYSLSSVTVERTSDPATIGKVADVLTWIESIASRNFLGEPLPSLVGSLARKSSAADFLAEGHNLGGKHK